MNIKHHDTMNTTTPPPRTDKEALTRDILAKLQKRVEEAERFRERFPEFESEAAKEVRIALTKLYSSEKMAETIANFPKKMRNRFIRENLD